MRNDKENIRTLLGVARRIAVVGIKADPTADAHRVSAYLKAQGYEILPVNPRFDSVLGQRCSSTLTQLPEAADLINIFRTPMHIPAHVDEILALPVHPVGVWMQLGIRHDESAERLRAAGIAVIQDRCIMVDHRRWMDM